MLRLAELYRESSKIFGAVIWDKAIAASSVDQALNAIVDIDAGRWIDSDGHLEGSGNFAQSTLCSRYKLSACRFHSRCVGIVR